jgi:hypothetical protein
MTREKDEREREREREEEESPLESFLQSRRNWWSRGATMMDQVRLSSYISMHRCNVDDDSPDESFVGRSERNQLSFM